MGLRHDGFRCYRRWRATPAPAYLGPCGPAVAGTAEAALAKLQCQPRLSTVSRSKCRFGQLAAVTHRRQAGHPSALGPATLFVGIPSNRLQPDALACRSKHTANTFAAIGAADDGSGFAEFYRSYRLVTETTEADPARTPAHPLAGLPTRCGSRWTRCGGHVAGNGLRYTDQRRHCPTWWTTSWPAG